MRHFDQRKINTMADAPKPHDGNTNTKNDTQPAPLWTGTGLCCEAQGDGIPCRGTDGECETCGRAMPTPPQAD